MNKVLVVIALGAMCSWANVCGADDIDSKELKDYKILPTQFANQTKFLQGIYLLRFSYSLVDKLPEEGFALLSSKSYKSVDELKTILRLQVPDILVKYETDLMKYGWTRDSLLRHMGIISNIDRHYRVNDPNYGSTDYLKLFDYQKDQCYSHFNEFPSNSDTEFDLLEKVAVPQNIVWSDFALEVEGKVLRLDRNGNLL